MCHNRLLAVSVPEKGETLIVRTFLDLQEKFSIGWKKETANFANLFFPNRLMPAV
jgi:hypothetical protein